MKEDKVHSRNERCFKIQFYIPLCPKKKMDQRALPVTEKEVLKYYTGSLYIETAMTCMDNRSVRGNVKGGKKASREMGGLNLKKKKSTKR